MNIPVPIPYKDAVHIIAEHRVNYGVDVDVEELISLIYKHPIKRVQSSLETIELELGEKLFNKLEVDMSVSSDRFQEIKNALLSNDNRRKKEEPIVEEVWIYLEDNEISIQFSGWQIVLRKDGTYFLNATDGG